MLPPMFQRRASFTLLLTLSIALGACGDDDGPDDVPFDGDVPDGDAGVPPDGFVDPDGSVDPGDLFPPPVITECPADPRGIPADLCEITAGTSGTLIVADILTPGEVLRDGKVLVDESGQITCVGCDCASADATELYCPEAVLSPGLINAHDHLAFNTAYPYPADGLLTEERYEHRHEWRGPENGHTRLPAGANPAIGEIMRARAEVRHLITGTTSSLSAGSSVGDGLMRNLDDSDELLGLTGPALQDDTFPLGSDTNNVNVTESCDYQSSADAADVMGDNEYVPHVAEGIALSARNEYLCMREGGSDVVEPAAAFIHGVGLNAADIAEMASSGVELIWSPRTNITLYGDTARVSTYARLGATIALGTDWLRSGSMNMLRELACADSFNQNHLGGFFPDEQLWLMATRNSAQALGFGDQIGTIATGYVADLALYDGRSDALHRAVIAAGAEDVLLVMRAGQPMFGDSAIVGALDPSCSDFGDTCGREMSICLGERGQTFAEFEAAAIAYAEGNDQVDLPLYPLFFCGEPDFEPSCLPARVPTDVGPGPVVNGSNTYSGMSVAGDPDGDGIMDGEDNCPTFFNPIRPMDNGMQADFDMDGIGDECDPCPLGGDDDPSTCVEVDPADRDGDGVPTDMDNCPTIPNPMQEDADMDGAGDACDACPMDANPGGAACPGTVYEVRMGSLSGVVELSDLIVTAVIPSGSDQGFYAQQDPASADYDGVDFSGIFIATSSAPTVSRGDLVDATGEVEDRFSQMQLTGATVTVTGTATVPDPVVVTDPSTLATNETVTGSRQEALESVLVRVDDVVVGDSTLGFGEFSITDGDPSGCAEATPCLRVDDAIFLVDPFPADGEAINTVIGPLGFSFGTSKIRPRDASDLLFPGLRVTPTSATVVVDGSFDLTVSIPAPAGAGGENVTITVAPADLLTGPAPLVVPAGTSVATGTYTARSTPGSGTLTVDYGGSMVVVAVEVIEPMGDGLLFTEYVEGSSFNKALEISNLSAAPIDLSACALTRHTNGGTGSSSTSPLSGTLAAGATLVICNGSADMALLDNCDMTDGVINHNGDDAYDLTCATMIIDTIGSTMADPGDAWTGGGVSTQNQTLRRLCSVSMGDTDLSDAYDPSTQWAQFASDTFDGLGDPSCAP